MVAIGNQWFWTYEVTKVLKLVNIHILELPLLTRVGGLSFISFTSTLLIVDFSSYLFRCRDHYLYLCPNDLRSE